MVLYYGSILFNKSFSFSLLFSHLCTVFIVVIYFRNSPHNIDYVYTLRLKYTYKTKTSRETENIHPKAERWKKELSSHWTEQGIQNSVIKREKERTTYILWLHRHSRDFFQHQRCAFECSYYDHGWIVVRCLIRLEFHRQLEPQMPIDVECWQVYSWLSLQNRRGIYFSMHLMRMMVVDRRLLLWLLLIAMIVWAVIRIPVRQCAE